MKSKYVVGDCVSACNYASGAKQFLGIVTKINSILYILYVLSVVGGNVIKIRFILDFYEDPLSQNESTKLLKLKKLLHHLVTIVILCPTVNSVHRLVNVILLILGNVP